MEENPVAPSRFENPFIRGAGVFVAVCSLIGVGFCGAYAVAQNIAAPGQTAAVATSVAPTPPVQSSAFASTTLIAKSAYVVDLKTGTVLYQQNANAQLPLASLTKVALMLVVASELSPDNVITIPVHTTPDGAAIRIGAGGEWHAQDLIDFTLVASSNEGAELLSGAADPEILAQYPQAPDTSPDSATIWRMNGLAQQLGLMNTYFLNVDGLDLSTTQSGAYGSAKDVATLLAYAASTSLSTFQATTHNEIVRSDLAGDQVTAQNTDEALPSIPGLIMGKTGYTDLAGGNLAIVFDAETDHPVVAVVMGSTEDGRFSDMRQLIPAIQQAIQEGQ